MKVESKFFQARRQENRWLVIGKTEYEWLDYYSFSMYRLIPAKEVRHILLAMDALANVMPDVKLKTMPPTE